MMVLIQDMRTSIINYGKPKEIPVTGLMMMPMDILMM
jgi:hypothetical protein